jgi:hypothetical protein
MSEMAFYPGNKPAFAPPNTRAARIYVLIARQAPRAIVFRRGPAKLTLVLVWNLADDTFDYGQWFKGRIYERRSDLSPDGELLVYAAASNRRPLYSWTAVSRPPYLTALALWHDPGMWGGALFGDDWRTLKFNFLSLSEAPMRPTGQKLPKTLAVSRLEHTVDETTLTTRRLERDGWVTRDEGVRVSSKRGSALGYSFDPPRVRERAIGGSGLRLRVQLHGLYEANGRPYVETCQIHDKHGQVVTDLGRIDWADVDHTGDVLYAADGCLFRLRLEQIPAKGEIAMPTKVADLDALIPALEMDDSRGIPATAEL